jgi:hypothetical protein
MRAVLRTVPDAGGAPGPSERGARSLDRLASAPFVGRDREVRSLLMALEESAAGRGQVRLVVGEGGIGKTRLVREVADRAARRDALVLWGRCWEEGGTPAYWPWIQIVRSYIRDIDAPTLFARLGKDATHVAQVVPDVREKLSPMLVPLPFDGEQARFRLFDAMASFLGRIAREGRPLVLVLDDLHNADLASLLLLRFVTHQLHELPILMLATCRDAEPQPTAAEQVLHDVVREGQRVRLAGLPRNDVDRFIRETAGSAAAPALVDGITELTQGNPFFIDEIVRLLVSTGQMQSRSRRALARLGVPDEVRKMIRRRLDPIGVAARELLGLASVIGRTFDLALLQEAGDLAGDRIVDLLAEPVAAHLLTEAAEAPGHYVFAHALVRETLYQNLAPHVRAGVHRRIGEILERRYAHDPAAHVRSLAHHFYQAALGGAAEKAVAYQAEAGRRALEILAYEEAAEHFARSLQALDRGGDQDPRRCELLLLLAEAQEKAGERGASRETLASAAALARSLDRPELLARAALGMAPGFVSLSLSSGTVDAEAVRLLEDALAASDRREDGGEGPVDAALRARLLGRLAIELYWSDEGPRRAALSEEAVNVARRAGDPLALAFALSARHVALWRPDNLEERLAMARDIVRLGEARGDPETALRGRVWLLTDLLELGDLQTADRTFQEYRRDAERLGQPVYVRFAATWQAMRAGLDGRFADAERWAAEALVLGNQMNDLDAGEAFTAQTIAFRAGRGLMEVARPTAEIVDRHPDAAVWRSTLALIHCDQGLEADARREFERLAGADFADIPRDADWLVTIFNLAQVCCFLLDQRRASILYDLLVPFADRCVVARSALVCLGSAGRALGMLAGTMSRWDEAEAHFQTAVRVNQELHATPLVALTRFGHGMMLLARSQGADPARALALFSEVRRTAAALRMDVLTRWIEPLASFVEVPAATGSSDADGAETPGDAAATRAVFREEGDCWAVGFDERLVRLRAAAGFGYIAHLLRAPGIAFHATELIRDASNSRNEPGMSAARIEPDASQFGRIARGLGDAGETLDRRAAGEYRRRLAELREEIEEAKRFNDDGRAARAEAELEFLRKQLVRDVGLGGRARATGSHAERARINVTRAIDRALAILGRRLPELGRYLDTTIKTGTFCSYTPDPRFRISWEL